MKIDICVPWELVCWQTSDLLSTSLLYNMRGYWVIVYAIRAIISYQ